MSNDPLWIEHAHLKTGAFTAKAKKAGESVQDYASDEADAPGRLGKQARLARTFAHHLSKKLTKGMD